MDFKVFQSDGGKDADLTTCRWEGAGMLITVFALLFERLKTSGLKED